MAEVTTRPGEVTEGLIAALEGEGLHIADSAFSLDPSKAREKLQAFQLEDPHAYVLLLVEAANIAGDNSIDFSCGRTTQATFEGVSLSRSELENVFNAVFGDARIAGLDGQDGAESPERTRARLQRHLGIAANAALALAPASIEIENVDAEGVLNRLTILPGGEVHCEPDGGGPPARTRFVFNGQREDFRDDHEVALLQERCKLTEMVVSLYGRQISGGSRAALLNLRTRRIKLGERTIGRAGLPLDWLSMSRGGELNLLTRGVLSETIQLEHAAGGFQAIVDTDLRKDLSQSAVIRDEDFDAVIDVVEACHARLTNQPRRALFDRS